MMHGASIDGSLTRRISLASISLLLAMLLFAVPASAEALSDNDRVFKLPDSIIMGLFDHQSLDRDKDGLKDEFENILADVWRPAFVFDEEENALQSFEPVVIFRVYPPEDWSVNQRPIRLKVQYGYLWRKDGGYEGASTWFETNAHWGDTAAGSYDLKSEDGINWMFEKAHLWDEHDALWANNSKIEWTEQRNTYFGKMARRPSPKIYVSSGKHHLYISKSECESDGPWHGAEDEDCDEGGQRIAQLTKNWRFNNVGEPEHHPHDEAPNTPFVNDLVHLGYKDEHVWSTRWSCYCESSDQRSDCFTGGLGKDWPGDLACVAVTPVYQLMAKHKLPGKKTGVAEKDVAILLAFL